MIRFVLCCLTLTIAACQAQPLSQGERDYAVSAMHATRKQFLDTVARLSDAQLKWKPSPEVWSAMEVAEHIALSDTAIPEIAAKAMQAPATPEKKSGNTRAKDEMLLKALAAREQKFKAPEMIVPKGQFKSMAELVAAFRSSRDRNIAYIRETQDELRTHFAPHPVFGELEVVQWYVLMAGHTERHVNQIKELMANPGFPKK